MRDADKSLEGRRKRGGLVQYVVTELLLSRVFPASVFGLIVIAKTEALARRLTPADARHLDPALFAFLAQQALTVVFVSLIVLLFLIRRPVIGQHSSLTGGLVALAGTFALTVPVGAKVLEDNTTVLLLSSAIVLVGVGFSVASLIALGRCFGLAPEARGLVTYGTYAWVRHPLYVGETISALGLVVGTASLPMAGVFVVYCGLQYWRTLNEEKALVDVFPEYEEYRRRTARFLPRIY